MATSRLDTGNEHSDKAQAAKAATRSPPGNRCGLSLFPARGTPMFNWLCPRHHRIEAHIMSDITDKLDAAVNAALAKIAAAGDVAAKDAQIAQLTADKAALQTELDAANADIAKNTDALTVATKG